MPKKQPPSLLPERQSESRLRENAREQAMLESARRREAEVEQAAELERVYDFLELARNKTENLKKIDQIGL